MPSITTNIMANVDASIVARQALQGVCLEPTLSERPLRSKKKPRKLFLKGPFTFQRAFLSCAWGS